MDQKVTVMISPLGEAESEELSDLIAGAVAQVDWVGTLNGQEVPVRLVLADDDEDEED